MNEPMNTVFVPVGMIMVAAKLAWDWYKRKRTQREYSEFTAKRPTGRQSAKQMGGDQFGRLVTSCFGDKGKAERLIAYEMNKGAKNRDAAIAAAMDRLSRDRAR
ncbi:hypothetical protein [Silvimonas soli]|uniref:hypothetical protein n=1 Tax=Silvimonas soli TaxID=2980100 RepID=UPI0024B3AAC5|nr:hypothetical protein [Silvimonas soli]